MTKASHLFGAFEAEAEAHPARVALQIKRGGSPLLFTYGDVLRAARAVAGSLGRGGIGPGARVVLIGENSPEWCVAYLGIVASGAAAVPLDAELTEAELATILPHAEPGAVIASERLVPRLEALAARLPARPRLISLGKSPGSGVEAFDDLAGGDGPPPPGAAADDPASILYTSGTTGDPKGVILTHRNLLANAEAVASLDVCRPDDNFLLLLPLHHAYPFMAGFLVPILAGARVTLLQTLKGPDILACMQETGVTILVGVPQLYAMFHRAIFDQVRRRLRARWAFGTALGAAGLGRTRWGVNAGRVIFRSIHRRFGGRVRFLVSGGAKLEVEVARDLEALGFTMLEGYGLTETAPVVTFTRPTRRKLGSVGPPLPGVEVKIVDPDSEGVGEVTIRGPNVMPGYFKKPAATAEVFRDGWFLSGDLGYLDDEGFLFITGRAKEVIVLASGKNVYPEDVERHFLKSPYIREACLVGVEGEGGIEGLELLVGPNLDTFRSRGVTHLEEWIRFEVENLSKALPASRRPRGIRITFDPLPRTRLGKIQRHRIGEIFRRASRPGTGGAEPLSPEDEALLGTEASRKALDVLAGVARKEKAIEPSDNLELDLGIDSLGRVELLVGLEQALGIAIPDEAAAGVFTVRELLRAVAGQGPLAAESGPARIRRGPNWAKILAEELPPDLARPLEEGRGPAAWIVTGLAYVLSLVAFRGLCRLEVRGVEHIPRRGPFLLTLNHASYIDAFAVASALPVGLVFAISYLGWQTFFQGRVMGFIGKSLRVIPVDMETYLIKALRMAGHVLRTGFPLCVFPEGGRSVDGEVKLFKKGVAILATELKVPLVPAYIEGSFEVWSRHERWPRPHKLRIAFGPPVTADELLRSAPPGTADDYERIAAALRQHVLALRPSPGL